MHADTPPEVADSGPYAEPDEGGWVVVAWDEAMSLCADIFMWPEAALHRDLSRLDVAYGALEARCDPFTGEKSARRRARLTPAALAEYWSGRYDWADARAKAEVPTKRDVFGPIPPPAPRPPEPAEDACAIGDHVGFRAAAFVAGVLYVAGVASSAAALALLKAWG